MTRPLRALIDEAIQLHHEAHDLNRIETRLELVEDEAEEPDMAAYPRVAFLLAEIRQALGWVRERERERASKVEAVMREAQA